MTKWTSGDLHHCSEQQPSLRKDLLCKEIEEKLLLLESIDQKVVGDP